MTKIADNIKHFEDLGCRVVIKQHRPGKWTADIHFKSNIGDYVEMRAGSKKSLLAKLVTFQDGILAQLVRMKLNRSDNNNY